MKRFSLLIMSLLTIGVWAQSGNEQKFSIEIGVTSFLFESSLGEMLDSLGYTDFSGWETSEVIASPYIGANVHFKEWALGIGVQDKKTYDIDVIRTTNAHVDQISSSDSWWSAYLERGFKLERKNQLFFAGGVTNAKIRGFVRRSGDIRRFEMNETEPFFRFGISRKFKNVQTRIDLIKRFTDSDTDNLMRVMLRVPLG